MNPQRNRSRSPIQNEESWPPDFPVPTASGDFEPDTAASKDGRLVRANKIR